ncbi:amino acid synthesis family protein [Pseudoroseicyclus sp. H15]
MSGVTIRKWYTQQDETLRNETGIEADGTPLRRALVAVAASNPYAGRFSEDLQEIVAPSAEIGAEIGRRLAAALGGDIESYGKACIVGANGEYEHGNAFLTQFAADPVREAVGGGKAWVPSTGKIGGPGSSIDVPLAFKDALYVRSHYDTLTASFADAPRPDEVLVIWAAASRGRLHARLGGLAREDVVGEDGLK